MDKLNYISNKLLEQVNFITSRLSPESKTLIKDNLDFMVKKFNEKYSTIKFFKYDELKENEDGKLDENTNYYRLVENHELTEEDKKKFPQLIGQKFDYSDSILNNFKNKYIYELNCVVTPEIKIKKFVHIYSDISSSNLQLNINRVITRIFNLVQIFHDKNIFSVEVFDFENPTTKIENYFEIFLYNNPRKANSKKKGEEYFKTIINTPMKCFNISSGLTENNYSASSRTEEIIGLLTHEFLHTINFVLYGNFFRIPKINKIEKDNENSIINLTEIFINTFASLFHAYLTSKELDLNFEFLLEKEFLHSIAQSVRLCKISGDDKTLLQLVEATPESKFIFYQSSMLFEYIIGRAFLLLNYKQIFSEEETFLNTIFDNSLRIGLFDAENEKLGEQIEKISLNIFSEEINAKNMGFLAEITKIVNEYIAEKQIVEIDNDTPESICGNMIMQYYALDVSSIDKDKEISTLYGGNNTYFKKYMKYKNKYVELKNKKFFN